MVKGTNSRNERLIDRINELKDELEGLDKDEQIARLTADNAAKDKEIERLHNGYTFVNSDDFVECRYCGSTYDAAGWVDTQRTADKYLEHLPTCILRHEAAEEGKR